MGANGKELPNVKVHPNPDFDIAIINITEPIVEQNIQGTWIPLDLFTTPEKMIGENITVGDGISSSATQTPSTILVMFPLY